MKITVNTFEKDDGYHASFDFHGGSYDVFLCPIDKYSEYYLDDITQWRLEKVIKDICFQEKAMAVMNAYESSKERGDEVWEGLGR